MILADKNDLKNGYRKHYSAYKILNSRNSKVVISKRLLLAYSVECGLKYKLLDEWKINSAKQIREIYQNKQHPKHAILGSHDLKKIIKELGQEGNFEFPRLKTIHSDNINVEEFHQMQRYGIAPDSNNISKTEDFEIVLRKIAEWIEEEI